MIRFYEFVKNKDNDDIQETLNKIPENHRNLVKNYRWTLQPYNTLKGDDGHVGVIKDKNKSITIACPWRFSRGFTALHEIAHKVYEVFVTPELRKKWSEIVKNTKNNKIKDTDEELFAHAYASTYAKYPPKTHYHKEWERFIRSLPK